MDSVSRSRAAQSDLTWGEAGVMSRLKRVCKVTHIQEVPVSHLLAWRSFVYSLRPSTATTSVNLPFLYKVTQNSNKRTYKKH